MFSDQQISQNYAETRVGSVMKRVYGIMTFGMLVTAAMAYICSAQAFMEYFQANSWLMWVLIIGEFAILFGVNSAITRLGTAAGVALFTIFAVINGMLMAPIFLVYTHASIFKTFLITAATFGAMSVYGFFTTRSLAKIGSVLVMALFGLLIAMLVNIFMKSESFDFIISIVGVLIFVGLTAWDTQQIKVLALQMPDAGLGRLAVLGALNLYLDFLNLFLFLLRIFGGSRD